MENVWIKRFQFQLTLTFVWIFTKDPLNSLKGSLNKVMPDIITDKVLETSSSVEKQNLLSNLSALFLNSINNANRIQIVYFLNPEVKKVVISGFRTKSVKLQVQYVRVASMII